MSIPFYENDKVMTTDKYYETFGRRFWGTVEISNLGVTVVRCDHQEGNIISDYYKCAVAMLTEDLQSAVQVVTPRETPPDDMWKLGTARQWFDNEDMDVKAYEGVAGYFYGGILMEKGYWIVKFNNVVRILSDEEFKRTYKEVTFQ